jgi:hypothetical protein
MKMPKPTDEDRRHFEELVPDDPRVVVKPMFGQLAAFVNGNMFLGLYGSDVGVKLPDDQTAALEAAGGGSFGPQERPMGGYVTLPAALDDADAAGYVAAALAYVGSLPPKKPKKK